jgi:hypothetical protein
LCRGCQYEADAFNHLRRQDEISARVTQGSEVLQKNEPDPGPSTVIDNGVKLSELYSGVFDLEENWELSSIDSAYMIDHSQETIDPGDSLPSVGRELVLDDIASFSVLGNEVDIAPLDVDAGKVVTQSPTPNCEDLEGLPVIQDMDLADLSALRKRIVDKCIHSDSGGATRHTRSKGPVPDYPNVQSKALEYKARTRSYDTA